MVLQMSNIRVGREVGRDGDRDVGGEIWERADTAGKNR